MIFRSLSKRKEKKGGGGEFSLSRHDFHDIQGNNIKPTIT